MEKGDTTEQEAAQIGVSGFRERALGRKDKGDGIDPLDSGLYESTQKPSRLSIDRYFSKEGQIPYHDPVRKWTQSDVTITDEGRASFVQKGVEFPDYFSQQSRQIVASRYFYGEQGTSERENSLRDIVDRVTTTIAEWGVKDEYFNLKDGEVFKDELACLFLDQYVSLNSPVWFNVGTNKFDSRKSKEQRQFYIIKDGKGVQVPFGQDHLYPQTSACFIQSVDDTMDDIMALALKEAMLFKFGSGTGTDLSTLRGSREKLSGGGKPSGPLPFL